MLNYQSNHAILPGISDSTFSRNKDGEECYACRAQHSWFSIGILRLVMLYDDGCLL
ncbi:MAG TPA: hypothetical protein VFV38_02440 [Ktedonobacteraceae bacterium]|nr:hypothetical protein [Ktedonobacteraceae bacterium]